LTRRYRVSVLTSFHATTPCFKNKFPNLWDTNQMAINDKITVYEKPTCTKCREMDRLLRDSGISFEKVNYYIAPLTEKKLRELLAKMNLPARGLLRTSEPIYRELGLGKDEFNEDKIISLMIEHPDLIQRPIVERGSRAVLGRPTENVKELL
jgi:arsenate reductase